MTALPLLHGIGAVQDLPVPAVVFYTGSSVVLVASFALLGRLWDQPLLERHERGRPLETLSRVVLSTPVRVVVQALSVLLFALVFWAAAAGSTSTFENLAPTFIYVVFWLGVPLLSVLFGNVWRVLSPWRAIADGFVWVADRAGMAPRPLVAYPERLGRWPAAVTLFAFVALELSYTEPASPRALAVATAIYTYVALLGYAAFGREAWHRSGEGFAVAFAYFARIAPLHVVDGRLALRWPFTGLGGAERVPGSLAVIAVMLGSVAFDGFSRTRQWQDLLARAQKPYLIDHPEQVDRIGMFVNLAGLLGIVLLVALAYVGTCALMRYSVGASSSLIDEFLLSLVPIAFVYLVAHYFSLFVIQGQFAIRLISDPLGRGWDLLGTATFSPNLTLLDPRTTWYVQVAALVDGPRRRPGHRSRPCRCPVPRPGHGDALPVPDARPDGRLHRRRALDPLPRLTAGPRQSARATLARWRRRRSPPARRRANRGAPGRGSGTAASGRSPASAHGRWQRTSRCWARSPSAPACTPGWCRLTWTTRRSCRCPSPRRPCC